MATTKSEGPSKAPGLKWRKRATGERIPYWCASPDAIAASWPTKTVNLSDAPDLVISRCERLQQEMEDFLRKTVLPVKGFDGTIAAAVALYQCHPESPYHRLKPSSRMPYDVYLARLRDIHGARHVARVTGLDVMEWHKAWRAPLTEGGKPRLAAATFVLDVLKGVLNWAIVCGFKECRDLREILSMLHLPRPQPRIEAPDAVAIEKARAAAHALGHHSAAFAYALQFETAIRQWDAIGQWVALSDKRPSSILGYGAKWIGPTWAVIDDRLILRYTPTKTEERTGKRVEIDLARCPMLMEELALIPSERRKGPLIVNEATGLPYQTYAFNAVWRKVRAKAELSPTLWNRDIRAGALTEGGIAGASSDDRAKLAGHVDRKMTQQVYDRDVLVGSSRVAEARAAFRKGNK